MQMSSLKKTCECSQFTQFMEYFYFNRHIENWLKLNQRLVIKVSRTLHLIIVVPLSQKIAVLFKRLCFVW